MSKNAFVWAQKGEKRNANYLFTLRLTVNEPTALNVNISASGAYTLFIDGTDVLHGPTRAAKGYFRADEATIALQEGENVISVLVTDYGVSNYAYVSQTPFFYCTLHVGDTWYTASDFDCFDFTPRMKRVQRYSFQRSFAEAYTLDCSYQELFANAKNRLPAVQLQAVDPLPKLPRRTPSAVRIPTQKGEKICCGTYATNPHLPFWMDRSITQIGNQFEGFPYEELEECLTDSISQTVFTKGENRNIFPAGTFALYHLSRNISGFINCKVRVLEDAEIYVTFDEALDQFGFVNAVRLRAASVVKWTLKKGKYTLQTLEPYTLQYAQVIVTRGTVEIAELSVSLFENPECYNVTAEIADDKLQRIIKAAQNTLAQNSVDLLMDCPSRERSGWSNDMYFTVKASEFLTGGFHAVENTLENFALYNDEGEIPQNMLPMCYPAGHINGLFIPQCAMWYASTLCEFLMKNPDSSLYATGKKNAYKALAYFANHENEDGLLEDLPGWNFIEWSKANSKAHVSGINYPTNMLYAKMLADMGRVYDDETLLQKSVILKEKIIEQAFNGEFFEDNRVRDENGKAKLQGHLTETCQYYAFLTGVADRERFPALYETIRDKLGAKRTDDFAPTMDKPNIIPGILARETVLLDNGEAGQVLDEVKNIFFVMAEHYQTLWEMVDNTMSCNHGIASYASALIIRALTGFNGFVNGKPVFTDTHATIDCEFLIDGTFGKTHIKVKNGKREIIHS